MAKIEYSKRPAAGAAVGSVTEANGGVAVADRAVHSPVVMPVAGPLAPTWLPALADAPTTALRMRRESAALPARAEHVEELPLAETVEPDLIVRGAIAVGRGPVTGVAAGTDGRLFVTNCSDDSVCVLDPTSLAVTATIDPVWEPTAIAAARGRAFAVTANPLIDTISVIEGDAIVATHAVAMSIRDLAVSPDGALLYIARVDEDIADIAVLDTVTGEVSGIEIGAGVVEAVVMSRDSARLYVATTDDDVIVIDTETRQRVAVVRIGAAIRSLAVTPDGAELYVLSSDPRGGALVDVVDTATRQIVESIELGGSPTQLVLSANGDRAYVVDGDRVLVLCTATHEILDTVSVGAAISCVTESLDGTTLYVADFDGRVTVLAVAPTAALLARLMRDHAIEPQRVRELESAGV